MTTLPQKILPQDLAAAASSAGAAPLLDISNLSVSYSSRGERVRMVHEVSLSIRPGEVLAVVGESGSGKTTTAQAVIGLLAENGQIDGGSIRLDGTDIAGWSPKQFESVRGQRIGLIPQDPNNSLNPVKTIGASLSEVLRIHRWGDKRATRARVIELLTRVGIPEPEVRARQYPHELSGGMKQRVLIASAIALQPDLIIADEATSALDVTVQKRILDLLDDLRAESGTALLLVTHDLAVAADRATRVVVMKDGRVQESGRTERVLGSPRADYTRTLLRDAPSFAAGYRTPRSLPGTLSRDLPGAGETESVPEEVPGIRVTHLVQEFARGRRAEPFRAVDEVSFTVPRGTTHALVGESGSGKTTTARAVVGLVRPTTGMIEVAGQDLAALTGEAARRFRKTVQLVYQNPFSSLDPRQSIAQIIGEPLRNYGRTTAAERAAAVADSLDHVALPRVLAGRRPRELSGGQRQRVAIARALILRPEVVVLDEAVSALDVTVQAQILDLLERLQDELGLTYLFISHDLAVVRHLSHTVSVMNRGRVIESGRTADVFGSPREEYTRTLLDAIPGRTPVTAPVTATPTSPHTP
ncbi:ABC transporter ATP-binding protein [Klugiella xanthotipulae]|uniref:Peptide/nickel transport system ATP-binding protein n=1 Tax=Klugiella xanthotipulae TaxID=244735 RepID=A0A543I5I7_9MICO|nr:ABC transporter ATP-binding protein [Klugiella xanthotipulae]TQM65873.1 peptide/nickel transport system ATP-binding protein [Klugiella xanthotipulae]